MKKLEKKSKSERLVREGRMSYFRLQMCAGAEANNLWWIRNMSVFVLSAPLSICPPPSNLSLVGSLICPVRLSITCAFVSPPLLFLRGPSGMVVCLPLFLLLPQSFPFFLGCGSEEREGKKMQMTQDNFSVLHQHRLPLENNKTAG